MSNVSPRRLSASQLVAAGNENVVTLPDPGSGRLGDLFAAAGAPGQTHELSWEFGARTAFSTESMAWSDGRRPLRRSPAVVAVVAITSLLVTSTGLAAATGLPGPAARVVDHVLGHIDLTIQPPETASVGAQSQSSGAPNPAAATSSAQVGGVSASSCSSTTHQSDFGSTCGLPTAGTNPSDRDGTSATSKGAAVSRKATTTTRSQSQKTGDSSEGTHSGGGHGGATGSNHGTNQGGTGRGSVGGNKGTGSGTGTGTNRGGNKGTGSGTGTGSNRGGNKGTGSNRGGNKGTGSGHHHHRGSDHGTAVPDPGTPSSGDDSGTG